MSDHFRVMREKFTKRGNMISILKDKLGIYVVRIFQAANIIVKF